jgi:hypothetical protein
MPARERRNTPLTVPIMISITMIIVATTLWEGWGGRARSPPPRHRPNKLNAAYTTASHAAIDLVRASFGDGTQTRDSILSAMLSITPW